MSAAAAWLWTAAVLLWSLGGLRWSAALAALTAPLSLPAGLLAKGLLLCVFQAAGILLFLALLCLPGAALLSHWLGDAPAPRRLAPALGLGLVMHSLLLTLLAACGWLRPDLVRLLPPGLAVMSLVLTGLSPLKSLAGWPAFWRGRPARDRIGWAALGLLLLGPGMAAVLSPTLFYDSLVYHLALPDQYLRAGSFVDFPYNHYAAFPFGWDILNVYGSAYGWAVLPKALSWGALAGLALACAGPGLRPLGGLLFCAMPAVLANLQGAGVEIAWSFFLTLAWSCFLEAEEQGDERLLRLGALFAGMTLAVKYVAVLPWVAGGLVLLWRRPSRRAALAYGAGAALVLPCLLKNLVYAGNPVHPFFAGALTERILGDVSGGGWRSALAHAPDLLRYGPSITEMDFAGPLPLWVLPLLWLGRGAAGLPALGAVLGLGALGWAGSTHIGRYLFPLFGLLSLAAGRAVEKTARPKAWQAAALCAAACSALTASFFVLRGTGWKVVLGEQPMPLYLAHERPGYFNPYTPIVGDVALLPPEAKLLLVGEARSFYLPRRCVMGTSFESQPLSAWAQEAGSASALLARLRAEGVTHLVLNLPELLRLQAGRPILDWSDRGRLAFAEFWRARVALKASRLRTQEDGRYGVALYEILPEDRPAGQAGPDNLVLAVERQAARR